MVIEMFIMTEFLQRNVQNEMLNHLCRFDHENMHYSEFFSGSSLSQMCNTGIYNLF